MVAARRLPVEERTQSAKAGRGARVRARLGQRLDRFNRRVAGIDVDSGRVVGITVILPLYGALDRYRL
jgi:hypothetical protein